MDIAETLVIIGVIVLVTLTGFHLWGYWPKTVKLQEEVDSPAQECLLPAAEKSALAPPAPALPAVKKGGVSPLTKSLLKKAVGQTFTETSNGKSHYPK